MFVRLARSEERQALAEFGAEHERYIREPRLLPATGRDFAAVPTGPSLIEA